MINFPTLGRNGIDIPRLLKFKELEALGCELHIFSGKFLRKIKLAGKDIYSFNETIPEFKSYPEIKWTKMKFMLFALKMNVRSLFYIRKIIKSEFDVIYSPAGMLDLVLFPRIIKLFSRKIVWTNSLDNIVPFSDPGNRFIRFLAWIFFQVSVFMLRKADVVFVPTEEIKDYLLKRKFPPGKLVRTGFAVENYMIEKARKNEDWKIDALFVGRINETKGIYDMLKVLELLVEKYPHFQFAIMGAGDVATEKKFKSRINEMNLLKNVLFLGFKTGQEKYNIIKSAKCFWFLSVSESESFGMALLEAVCSGVPAFAYKLPQFSWLYPNGEIDVSPKGDWKMVAEKVLKLFESGNFENEKGKLLLGKFSWKKIAEMENNAIKNT